MAQSIVQVTHSHNPSSPRRIHFNYWYQSKLNKEYNTSELKRGIQITCLIFLIIHICSNEIQDYLFFLPEMLYDQLKISTIYLLYKGPEIPCLRIIGKCININTVVRRGNTKVCKL